MESSKTTEMRIIHIKKKEPKTCLKKELRR